MKTKILQKAFLTLTAPRNRGCVRFFNLLFAGTILILALTLVSPANAQGQMIGTNVLLNQPPSNSILQDLGTHGEELDVISQISGGTLRAYFPEERIAVEFARSFSGGGGERGTVSSQPETWERDTSGHGIAVTSVILGFRYNLVDPPLPATFNGVAPKATVIPVKRFGEAGSFAVWYSTLTRALVYLTDLKVDGHLGNSPLVINHSGGGSSDDVLVRAAIDYAIAHGVVLVSPAGNSGTDGMIFPARYAPVISAGATGWIGEL